MCECTFIITSSGLLSGLRSFSSISERICKVRSRYLRHKFSKVSTAFSSWYNWKRDQLQKRETHFQTYLYSCIINFRYDISQCIRQSDNDFLIIHIFLEKLYERFVNIIRFNDIAAAFISRNYAEKKEIENL